MRSHVIIVVAVALVVALVLSLIDFPGIPDFLLDAALLILVGGALLLSGWIRTTMFR